MGSTTTTTSTFVEGTLIVDDEAGSKKLVWRGIGTDMLSKKAAEQREENRQSRRENVQGQEEVPSEAKGLTPGLGRRRGPLLHTTWGSGPVRNVRAGPMRCRSMS